MEHAIHKPIIKKQEYFSRKRRRISTLRYGIECLTICSYSSSLGVKCNRCSFTERCLPFSECNVASVRENENIKMTFLHRIRNKLYFSSAYNKESKFVEVDKNITKAREAEAEKENYITRVYG